MLLVIGLIVGLAAGIAAGYVARHRQGLARIGSAEARASGLIGEAGLGKSRLLAEALGARLRSE